MTLAKVDGFNGEVFIPEDISQEDQNFLIDCSVEIVEIVNSTRYELGAKFVKVERRFKADRCFGGQGGWYRKWYESLEFTETQKRDFVNVYYLVLNNPGYRSVVEKLERKTVQALAQPSLRSGNSGTVVGGASLELQDHILFEKNLELCADVSAECTSKGSIKSIDEVKRCGLNQILSAEQIVQQKHDLVEQTKLARTQGPSKSEDSKEYNHLRKQHQIAENSLKEAEKRLLSLEQEKKSLKDKYENWRSPEAIKQEFDEAIEKARAEERAKKEQKKVDSSRVKAVEELHLREVEANRKLQAELDDLRSQISSNVQSTDTLDVQLSQTKAENEKLKSQLRKQSNKLEDLESRSPYELSSPVIRQGCVLAGINGFHDAAVGYGYALFHDFKDDHDNEMAQRLTNEAVISISEWLPYLKPEARQMLIQQLQGLGDSPAQTIQTTKLNTIN